MSIIIFQLRETYRNIPIGGSVCIETIEVIPGVKYVSIVQWDDDPDESAQFETRSMTDAMERHDRLCAVFRKYAIMWQCVEKIFNAATPPQEVILVSQH